MAAGLNADGLCRKQRVLAALESSLRRELPERGISPGVVDCLLEVVGAEALQLRLMCEGGSPLETIRAETSLFRIQYADASAAQRFVHGASLLPAWLLPPEWFYRARSWLRTRTWYSQVRKAIVAVPTINGNIGAKRAEKTGTGIQRNESANRERRTMTNARDTALTSHREYYTAGTYDDDRLKWTLDTFVSISRPSKVLEVGCGDGTMLGLLAERDIVAQGVDASSSGIERCLQRGLQAQCLDVSTDGLPFPDDEFDLVISLETFEHLMNPHFALQEVRRVLRSSGRFLCSVPNPLTGHPYLYPGLFEYRNFRRFLEQSGFLIERVSPWQWAPRETILPSALRRVPFLQSRWIAGTIRRVIEKSYLAFGAYPAFCYWLWTFDCQNDKSAGANVYEDVSAQTRPGSTSHFASKP